MPNKTRTSKVGAISKAQKPQNIFLEEKLEKFEFFSLGKVRIVPKKGGFINIHLVAKYEKPRKGDPFETLKFFSKKLAQCQKTSKGGLF